MSRGPLSTERLLLRPWQADDLPGFAALNADPEVMEFFPSRLTPEQSAEFVRRQAARIEEDRPALLAVERREDGAFLGFVGLAEPVFEAPFLPAVEIGWRLARQAWGHGYASEAARAVAADGFERFGLSEIISFTARLNLRSQRVMQRIGMVHAGDFEHPAIEVGHPLRPHVRYRLTAGMLR